MKSIQDLRKWLQPTEYLSPGSEYMKHLSSYVPGTGDWLRHSETFRRWKDGTETGCLWVRGIPGSGKSVFAASTVSILMGKRDDERAEWPGLFFFFRQIVEKNHHPKYLIRDWVAQLLPSSQDLREKVDALSKEVVVDGIELTKLWDALVDALEKIEKVYCVADALDEMDDEHASFVEKLKELGMKRPGDIKVLLTSRPIPRIENQLRHPRIEAVKLEPTRINDDIARYLSLRIERIGPRIAEEKKNLVEEAIYKRAEGLFLYARLMIDSLTEGLREGTIVEYTLPASLEQLPSNLKELYTRILAETSRRSGITQEQQFTILQCVINSSRPLRLIELGSIIALLRKETRSGLRNGKDLVRQACGRLLEILEDESISVIHHSFTEFMRDESRNGELGAFPVMREIEAQRMMVQVCLQYLNSCVLPESAHISKNETPEALEENTSDWDMVSDEIKETEQVNEMEINDSGSGIGDAFDDPAGRAHADEIKHQQIQDLRIIYPLISYATDNLIHHIQHAEIVGVNVFDLLDSYFVPGNKAFQVFLLTKWHQYRHGNVQPLHIAAYFGLSQYAQQLIATGSTVDVRDAEGRTALFYAAEKGHVDVASLLLSNGADPDCDDRIGYKPLHVATSKNQPGIVKLLLAAGVSPKTEKSKSTPELINEMLGDDKGETPLQAALSRGHTEIITQFIHCIGVDDACRGLHQAVQSRKVDAVEAILKTGKAPVDVLVSGVTALFSAADNMQPDIIEVLLRHGANPNLRTEGSSSSYHFSLGGEIKFKSQSKHGATAMHAFAGIKGNTALWGDREQAAKCLQLLVDAGSNINLKIAGGLTPLHNACKKRYLMFGEYTAKGRTEEIIAELLLERGANPKARCDSGATPLHHVTPQCPKLVEILVRNGADVNARDNNGSTPLLSIIDTMIRTRNPDEWTGEKAKLNEETIFKLLEHGADVTVETDKGLTVFHYMFAGIDKFHNEKLWEALIKAGADLNKPNRVGKSPVLSMMDHDRGKPANANLLQILVKQGLKLNPIEMSNPKVLFKLFDIRYGRHPKLVSFQELANLGCNFKARDKKGATLLHYCIRSCASFDIFQFLVDAGVDLSAVDKHDNTLFHAAASLNRLAVPSRGRLSYVLKILVERGVPTDSHNKDGLTPLHIVCAKSVYGWDERTKGLLDLLYDGKLCPRSNIEARDNLGATPIHYAASISELQVWRLVQAGADPTVKTSERLTPLHIAARGRQSNVIGFLLSEYRKRKVLELVIDEKDMSGRTALHYACRSGQHESVSYLLSAGANHSVRDALDRTPLHALAEFPEEHVLWTARTSDDRLQQEFDAACVTLWDLKRPFPAWQLDNTVRTREILEMLEKVGADLRAIDRKGHTPIEIAVQTKCTEMVNELRNRGLTPKDGPTEVVSPQRWLAEKARALLGKADPPRRGARHGSEGGRNKEHQKKMEEILQQADYPLFHKFIEQGGNLTVREGPWHKTTLHILVEWGHANLLKAFSKEAAGLDDMGWMEEEDNPGTLLCHACEQISPRLDVIKVLVEIAKVNVNKVSSHDRGYGEESKAMAIHWLAAGENFWNIEALEYLLDHGADIEARNGQGKTPLMVAVGTDPQNGLWKEETTRVLLQRGANPNALSTEGTTCLNMADRPSLTRMLLSYGADFTASNYSCVTSAVKAIDENVTRTLLEAGADPNTDWPLYEAAKTNEKYEDEYHILGGKTQIDMITLLLRHGADPFARIGESSVLQDLIEERGVLDLFWKLPNFPIDRPGKGGRTPLISACYPTVTLEPYSPLHPKPKPKPVCNPTAALTLIQKGANVKAVDDLGRTALHWLCILHEELDDTHQSLFEAILDSSPNLIHQRDNQGFKPLHLAVAGPHVHDWISSHLISLGSDPTSPDPDGNTALHYLASQLVGEKTKASAAAARFRAFLTLGLPINHRNNLGETPIFRFMSTCWEGSKPLSGSYNPKKYAIEHDMSHLQALPVFLDAGADLHTRNANGEGLLHATAKRVRKREQWQDGDQRADMLGIWGELITRGVDLKVEDAEFRTAVDVAVAVGNTFLVDALVKKE